MPLIRLDWHFFFILNYSTCSHIKLTYPHKATPSQEMGDFTTTYSNILCWPKGLTLLTLIKSLKHISRKQFIIILDPCPNYESIINSDPVWWPQGGERSWILHWRWWSTKIIIRLHRSIETIQILELEVRLCPLVLNDQNNFFGL